MADSQLFDVVLCGAKSNKPMTLRARNVPMADAIQISTEWNEHPQHTMTAVVAMAGTVQCSMEPSSGDSDESDEQDDSIVECDSENATEANVVGGLVGEVTERRCKFIRREYRRQIKRLWAATEHVYDEADLGIVARSLELLSRATGDTDELNMDFHEGLCGGFHNDELEAALGL